ncbi:MAG: hypothetical protein JWQ07_3093 [Ramlibacter sp.]|nr:hypothetical protein [Ramlibacter sp.]
MLQAAHAAAYLWRAVGGAKNDAHAALLLAHTHALVGRGEEAAAFEAAGWPYFRGDSAVPWERAIAQAVAANVAAANGREAEHAELYAAAARLIEALPDPADREILGATLRVVPAPNARAV